MLKLATAFAAAPTFTSTSRAQTSNVMTLVVPFPPGGSTDALARLLQPQLQTKLGRTIVIENKPGVSGALGAAQVSKSPPDGSSLLVTFDSHAVIPAIVAKPPLDVETDMEPVLLVGTAPYVLAANAGRPFKTFADVVAASKAKPGSVKYASVGVGTYGHLAMTVLAQRAGVEITHIPYRGGGPAMTDVVGGHVDLICGSAALITPQLPSGTIRPVMQMGKQRLHALGDTQTAIEAGFADFEAVAWWGVFAAKSTPATVVDPLAQTIKMILSEQANAARLKETQQMTLVLGGPAELRRFLGQQVQQWGKVVRDYDIRAN
jgi:tripartite-type tricarboxylate transporter receptor subunit TctC